MEPDGADARRPGPGLLYAGLAAAVAAAFLLSPEAMGRGPTVCAFRRATGVPCPGCGLTRSWVLAAHGRLPSAFGEHAFGPPTLAAAAFILSRGPSGLAGLGRGAGAQVAEGLLAAAWLGWAGRRMRRAAR